MSNKFMGDTFLVLSRRAAHYNISVLCGFRRSVCGERETGLYPLLELYAWRPVLHIASLWNFPSFLPQSSYHSLPLFQFSSSHFVRDVGILAKGSFFLALNSACEGVSLRTQDEWKLERNLVAYLLWLFFMRNSPVLLVWFLWFYSLAILLKEKGWILA